MAVEDINAKGGIMGHKVEAFFADNKGTPPSAPSGSSRTWTRST
jgi:ABC-type branched-subunit amino acid transport system substrate-binding protein